MRRLLQETKTLLQIQLLYQSTEQIIINQAIQPGLCYSCMSLQVTSQSYAYTLTIRTLTLKVKFPCRLYFQHNNQPVTSHVSPNAHSKCTFNQEVTLKNQTDKEHVELVVYLQTDKGSKYVGGVVKMQERTLIESEGQVLMLPVSKCLDSEATCELRVDQVTVCKVSKPKHHQKTRFRTEYDEEGDLSYRGAESRRVKAADGQTKSEYNVHLSASGNKRHQDTPLIKNHTIVLNTMKRQYNQGMHTSQTFEKEGSMVGGKAPLSALEFEVYKEGYNKLKDKYRREVETSREEAGKRLALENSQNTLRLDVMRYKLKAEELEKTLQDKNEKMRELGVEATERQKKESEVRLLKQQAGQRERKVASLQQKTEAMGKQIASLKLMNQQQHQKEQKAILQLRQDLARQGKRYHQRQAELSATLQTLQETLLKKEEEINSKNEQVRRLQRQLQDSEQLMTNRTLEFEKSQKKERGSWRDKEVEERKRLDQLKTEMNALLRKLEDNERDLDGKKAENVQLQYEKKILMEGNQRLVQENQDLKKVRDKHIELVRTHQRLTEQHEILTKNSQKDISNRQQEIHGLKQQLQTHLKLHASQTKEWQEKIKSTLGKLNNAEQQQQSLNSMLDKVKRHNDSLLKEVAQKVEQLTQAKQQLKEQQESMLALSSDLTDTRAKTGHSEHALKLEVKRLKEEVSALERGWDEERIRNNEYVDQINRMDSESSRRKKEWQLKEEQLNRQLNQSKDKIEMMEDRKKEIEGQMANMNKTVDSLKKKERDLTEKIQNMQLQAMRARQSIQSLKKQVKVGQEKNNRGLHALKMKCQQLAEIATEIEAMNTQGAQREMELAQTRSDLKKAHISLEKQQKIEEHLKKQAIKQQEEQRRLHEVVHKREEEEIKLRGQLKIQKELNTKLQLKNNSLNAQFDKFKQSISETIQNIQNSIPEGLSPEDGKMLKSSIHLGQTTRQNTQVIGQLVTMGKQLRTNMLKTIEQLKQRIRQQESLQSTHLNIVDRSSSNEYSLKQNIDQLEAEIKDINAARVKEKNQAEERAFVLESRIRQKEAEVDELMRQQAASDLAYDNLRTEQNLEEREHSGREKGLKKMIHQLKNQVDDQMAEIKGLDLSLEKTAQSLQDTRQDLETTQHVLSSTQIQLKQTQEERQQALYERQRTVKELKKAKDNIEELTLELDQTKDSMQKAETALSQEQHKTSELRQFIASLMKEKEKLIKEELEKSEQIVDHQNTINFLKLQQERLEEQLSKGKGQRLQLQHNLNQTQQKLKQEESNHQEQCAKSGRLTDKLREVERQKVLAQEAKKDLEEKYKKDKEKLSKRVKELEDELDETMGGKLQGQRDNNQKVLTLESDKDQLKRDKCRLQQTVSSLHEELFAQRQKNNNLTEQRDKFQLELSEAEQTITHLEGRIQAKENELTQREEQAYKMQGTIVTLESRVDFKEKQHADQIMNINEDWESKYQQLEKDHRQEVVSLMGKNGKFLEQVGDKDRELIKLMADIQQLQNTIETVKKQCQEKVKSIEDERTHMMAQKNEEIQRMALQVQQYYQRIRQKQAQNHTTNSDLDMVKLALERAEERLKDSEERSKVFEGKYQKECQGGKRRESALRRWREQVQGGLWRAQREVRKAVQESGRKVVELADEKIVGQVIELVRVLEDSVGGLLAIKLPQEV